MRYKSQTWRWIRVSRETHQTLKNLSEFEGRTMRKIVEIAIKKYSPKKMVLLLCSLLLTTSAFAGSVEQAKAEIEQMELTGVSVKTVDLKTFTQDQEARIKEAITSINKGGKNGKKEQKSFLRLL